MLTESMIPEVETGVDEVGTLLERAADAIERFGHTKYKLGSKKEGFCLIGAIYYAHCGDAHSFSYAPIIIQAIREVESILPNEDMYFNTPNLVTWNNRPERTRQEVIRILKETAAHR